MCLQYACRHVPATCKMDVILIARWSGNVWKQSFLSRDCLAWHPLPSPFSSELYQTYIMIYRSWYYSCQWNGPTCECVWERESGWSCYPLGKHAYFITRKAHFISIIWLSGCHPLFMRSLDVGVWVSVCPCVHCMCAPSGAKEGTRIMYISWLL